LSDSAAQKLAFRTHRGLWQFKRMPFGYRNGPSVFQRVMQKVLAPFLWIFALVYIDDIVVFSLTFKEHLRHLDQVFQGISKANITLSPGKCHFAYQSLLLLGQKVSRLGLSTHREKVDAITSLIEPKNVSELQTFLGMMVYFSNYVPFYAWIAHPFFELLKKESTWRWEQIHQEAFELCKEVLTNAPIRGYAKPGLPYRVYTDACDYGLAGILQQVQPIAIKDLHGTKAYEKLEKAYRQKEQVPNLVITIDKAETDVPTPGDWSENFEDTIVYVERVISYWSRVLKSAERNYSPTEREALALKEALIKFQPFLEGEKVYAITDHAALTWSRTFQNVNRRLLTWGTVFAAYPNLKIVHRAGKVHSNVDPISRLRHRVPEASGPVTDDNAIIKLSPDSEDVMRNMYQELGNRFEEKLLTVAARFVESEDEEPLNVHVSKVETKGNESGTDYHTAKNYSIVIGIGQKEINQWIEAYEDDIHFKDVIKSKRQDKEILQPTYPQYFYADSGLIYFEDALGNNCLCVPYKLRKLIMEEVHETCTEAAHSGYYKTYNRIASTYYWPRMSRDIKLFTKSCDICQKSKPRRHAPVGLLQPIPIPSYPFEVVTMDFIPELPNSEGFDNILVVVDKLTKYGLFIPCSTKIGEVETAQLFFKHVIAHYGIPRQVITDRDSRWRNDFWGEICRLMGMKRALTTSYHPQADGQTEILNQTLEIALRAYVGPSRTDWVEHINGLMLAYNSTPHTATQFAPAHLLRGYTPVTRSTLLHHANPIDRTGIIADNETDQRVEEMMDAFLADRTRAQEALKLGQVFQQKAYNKGRLIQEFEEGDLVVLNPHSLELLKNEKGRGKKLLMRYDRPFEILRKLSPVTYQLRLPASYHMHPILNIAHLEAYTRSPPEFGERITKRLNRKSFEDLPEEEVEFIVGERMRKVKNRRVREYKARFKDSDPATDTWLTRQGLKNVPDILAKWERTKQRINTGSLSVDEARGVELISENESG